MKISGLAKRILVAALAVVASHAVAEDIDIYQANNNSSTSNLLIVFDNSASGWSSNATTTCPYALGDLSSSGGGVQACGMWRAVEAIRTTPALLGKLNMGIMMLSQPPTNGGTFRFPATARPNALVPMTATGITQMQTNLKALVGNDKSSSRDVGGSTWEAWAFYAGKIGASGAPTYPGIASDTCGKNFVIRVGVADNNANPADQSSNSAGVLAGMVAAGAGTTQQQQINWVNDNKFVDRWGDEWARFSKQNNAITTYTITLKDTGATDTQNVSSYVRFMKSVADVSGGKAFVVDINDMDGFVQALLAIFNEVNAVNSVFASASLPISSNGTGNFLNQVYFGMFRPDPAGLPRWAGNLKQYRFALDLSDPLDLKLFLADARAPTTATRADNTTYPVFREALSAGGTGFFDPNAVSFWTTTSCPPNAAGVYTCTGSSTLPDTIDPTGALGVNGGVAGGFFINRPAGASTSEGFDFPDGEVVEKGGVSQRIRMENLVNNYAVAAGTASTPGVPGNPRRIYTCSTPSCVAGSPGSPLANTPFALSNLDLTDAVLGTGAPPTNVSTLTRNNTTATVTTAAAMNPILGDGQIVTLSGTSYPQFKGDVVAGGPPTATTFTFPVIVYPPVNATGSGYVASTPGFLPPTPVSITRVGAVAEVALVAHPFSVGQTITIANAGTGFDKTVAIIACAAPTADKFCYPITVTPSSPSTGAAATNKVTPAGADRVINVGNLRYTTIGAGPSFTVRVLVTTATDHNYVLGDNIRITGAIPAEFNIASTPFIPTTGNSGLCPVGNPAAKNFCYDLPTTPAGTAALTATVTTPGSSVTITSITRDTSCTPGSTPPNVKTAIATATTALAHGFAAGSTVDINGGDASSALYTGTAYTVLASPAPTVVAPHQFSYTINTDLPCSDPSLTMKVAVGGTDRTTLINWIRGESRGDEGGPGAPINVRPSIHGDVLHSRPTIVNYGDPASTPGVVVFYGSNDGTFRAINGNQTQAISGISAGGELWSFIAPEFFSKMTRQYLNTPVVKLESTPASILPTPRPKDYFFDGSVGVYQNITTGQVVLYLTTRRGGRLIYAIDVTTPTNPKLMWKKSSADTGFGELGQTWSAPRVALVKGYNDGASPTPNAKPVLIFGAGYHGGANPDGTFIGQDKEPPEAATMGRGIFILDALTGSIVWHATSGAAAGTNTCTTATPGTNPCLLDMPYPIPADVTLIDRDRSDGNGYVDRIYAADLGGNVWRVDLEPAAGAAGGFAPSSWRVSKLAAVGGAAADPTKRKIFFAPDVVTTPNFDAVLFTTGDREHPTRTQQSVNIINRFYMVKDPKVGNDACPVVAGTPTCTTTILDDTSSTANTLVVTDLFNASPTLPTTTASNTPFTPGPAYNQTLKGFFVTLRNVVARKQTDGTTLYGPDLEGGEKGVNAPTSIGGNTFFGTNSPIDPVVTGPTCQPNLGTARGYSINFITGELKTVIYDGGGLPPSPVSGVVAVDDGTGTGNTIPVPFLIGGVAPDCSGPLCASKPPIPIEPLRSRTYWYRDIGNR